MLNRSAVALIAIILPLAGCDSGPSVVVTNGSAEDVAKEVSAAGGATSFVNPGKWESKITIEEVTMPGMPPEVAAHAKGMMGNARSVQSCVTPEQAQRPKEDFFAGTDTGCRYDHFAMGGGKIDALMKCTARGATQVMQLAGTYSADSYSMTMNSTASGAGSAGGMKMRMRVDAKRLGPCDGTEAKS